MKFIDFQHYFDFCAVIEKRWRARMSMRPKVRAVNQKLAAWHAKNPSNGPVVSLAKWRLDRARRQA